MRSPRFGGRLLRRLAPCRVNQRRALTPLRLVHRQRVVPPWLLNRRFRTLRVPSARPSCSGQRRSAPPWHSRQDGLQALGPLMSIDSYGESYDRFKKARARRRECHDITT